MIKTQLSRQQYKNFLISKNAYEGQDLSKIPDIEEEEKEYKGIKKGLLRWIN